MTTTRSNEYLLTPDLDPKTLSEIKRRALKDTKKAGVAVSNEVQKELRRIIKEK